MSVTNNMDITNNNMNTLNNIDNDNNQHNDRFINPELYERYFQYTCKSNRNDIDGTWTYEKVFDIIRHCNLTNNIKGLDLKTPNIHADTEELTYKHFEISFKDEPSYLKFLYSGYVHRNRTIFPYPKEQDTRPERQETQDNKYYINVTNVPLQANENDINRFITQHLGELKNTVDLNIIQVRNIQHTFISEPQVAVKTGRWEITIETAEPLKPRENENHKIETKSVFFSRLTPVNVLKKTYEETQEDIKNGRNKFKRFITFTISQIDKNITRAHIMKCIQNAIQDKQAHKYVDDKNVDIRIKEMPIINKCTADIIMDRRLQPKVNLATLTNQLHAVRPIFGKAAYTMEEGRQQTHESIYNQEQEEQARHKRIQQTNGPDNNNIEDMDIVITENADNQDNQAHHEETNQLKSQVNNETQNTTTGSTDETTQEIHTATTITDSNVHISDNTTIISNTHANILETSEGKDEGEGHGGGSEMRTNVTSPTLVEPASAEYLLATQVSRNSIVKNKSLINQANPLPTIPTKPSYSTAISTPPSITKSPETKQTNGKEVLSKGMKSIKRKGKDGSSDEELSTGNKKAQLDTENLEQKIKDITNLQLHAENTDEYKYALAETILRYNGQEQIYAKHNQPEELTYGKAAILRQQYGIFKDNDTRYNKLPNDIKKKWRQINRKDLPVDKNEQNRYINILINNINENINKKDEISEIPVGIIPETQTLNNENHNDKT